MGTRLYLPLRLWIEAEWAGATFSKLPRKILGKILGSFENVAAGVCDVQWWRRLRIKWCHWPTLSRNRTALYWRQSPVFVIIIIIITMVYFRQVTSVITRPNHIQIDLKAQQSLTNRALFASHKLCTYRVGQIKWHHFTFLLVTN